MNAEYDEKNPTPFIKNAADEATKWKIIFINVSPECDHFRLNHMTRARNCFHNNTKTECDFFICPLKGEN